MFLGGFGDGFTLHSVFFFQKIVITKNIFNHVKMVLCLDTDVVRMPPKVEGEIVISS